MANLSRGDLPAYLGLLDHLCPVAGRYFRIPAAPDAAEALPPVVVAWYANAPEAGSSTAFTWGLSEAEHPDWTMGKVELLCTVDSLDPDWGLVLGHIVRDLRGREPFGVGTVVDVGRPIARGSALSAFLVHLPTVLPPEAFPLCLPGRTLFLFQAIPIHDDELGLIERVGVEAFANDPRLNVYDVTRASLAG